MYFEFYGVTHQGMVRSNNEDSFSVPDSASEDGLCIVADGMGGHRSGEVASRLAVNTFEEEFHRHLSDGNIDSALRCSVDYCNEKVFMEAATRPEYINMGTTVVACYLKDNTANIINVGDSRAYHIHEGNCTQITTDHSVVQELLEKKLINEKQAKQHPQRNVITKAVGIDASVEGDIFHVELLAGDFILMCSDGLTEHINLEDMAVLFNNDCNIYVAADTLVNLALAAGGTDNITLILIACRENADN